jgi:hypothetical protein
MSNRSASYSSTLRSFGFYSELESIVLGCEAKYLAERSLVKKVKKVFNGDDVHRHLCQVRQEIQKAYTKWMVCLCMEMMVQPLTRVQVRD